MTELIASIAGPYWVATGLGFLLSRAFYERMVLGNGKADPILLNLSGMVHFMLGMIVLVNHFLWDSTAQIAVTLLGIMLVLKGGFLIAVPEIVLKTPKTVGKTLAVSTVGFLIVGLYFCYVGYRPTY
jgi:hypothetical protein